jgi:alpha-L-fucosidase
MNRIICLFMNLFFSAACYSQLVKDVEPVPTKDQLKWHEMEFYIFMHFGPNTFTGLEWGHGTEDEKIFNPTQLDCRQWARIARDAGAKGIIITAKHHDGFSLWPSKQGKHTVRESGWRNGKGDVLRELSKACKDYGLLFGVYISPWDRNHPDYGTPKYNKVYLRTMREIIKRYGPLFELWWDGANGEGPNGKKQVYDFRRFEKLVRKLAPHTLVFSDIGPDIRWVGNERGIAGTTNWNLLDTAGFTRGHGAPPTKVLNTGNENGANWIPAECDVSIRPGWFYHAKEDSLVKSGTELMRLYLASVGRGANFLLNVPPDTRGLIHENDSAALMAFKQIKEDFFKENIALRRKTTASSSMPTRMAQLVTDGVGFSYWAAAPTDTTANIEIDLGSIKAFNTILLQEAIEFGQRVKDFSVEVWDGSAYKEIASGTTIGYKRILQFTEQSASRIRVAFRKAKASPVINEIQLFKSAAMNADGLLHK